METSKSVRAQINDLEIGGAVTFPITRYDYVVSCKARLQTVTEKRFSSTQDKPNGVVIITRQNDKPQ